MWEVLFYASVRRTDFRGTEKLLIVPSSTNVYQIVGRNLRAARIKAGITQEQLAEKSNLARNYIGNIERAEKKISLETLAQIAKALKVGLDELVRGTK